MYEDVCMCQCISTPVCVFVCALEWDHEIGLSFSPRSSGPWPTDQYLTAHYSSFSLFCFSVTVQMTWDCVIIMCDGFSFLSLLLLFFPIHRACFHWFLFTTPIVIVHMTTLWLGFVVTVVCFTYVLWLWFVLCCVVSYHLCRGCMLVLLGLPLVCMCVCVCV